MERDLDVIVFGATGFVGKLTAQELLRSAPEGTRIALAGRDRDKLQRTAEEVGASHLPIVIADASDEASLAAMVERTKALISTVGPYARHGRPVVAACARAGTHYVDLTGEVLFTRDTIDDCDSTAQESGATLVLSCGFDCVPSDLGVLLAADAAAEAGAGELLATTTHLRDMAGGFSGGTYATMLDQVETARRDQQAAALIADPYALSPDRSAEPERPGRRAPGVLLETSPDTGELAGPFVMGDFNAQVVRRSNALQGWRYGRAFRYREVSDAGHGVRGVVGGLVRAAMMPVAATILSLPGGRKLAERALPSPGEGPSEKARAKGRFTLEVHAQTTSGRTVVARVSDTRDPGYGSTAVMLSQAALALAAGEALRPGVVTPAAGLGQPYAQRLRDHGLRLEATVAA